MNDLEKEWAKDDLEKECTKIAEDSLKGRTIVDVRYMTEKERDKLGW